METKRRPTKKQKEMLNYIEEFIAKNGYGPSYREIMKGCGYNSVATVALHINNLIKRGYLRKKDRSSRSLEPVSQSHQTDNIKTNVISPNEEKWLISKIDYKFNSAEASGAVTQDELDGLRVLTGALNVLGLDGAYNSFSARLGKIKANQ